MKESLGLEETPRVHGALQRKGKDLRWGAGLGLLGGPLGLFYAAPLPVAAASTAGYVAAILLLRLIPVFGTVAVAYLVPLVHLGCAAAGAAYAAPTPNQMPGAGQFMVGSLSSALGVNGPAVPVGTTITGLVNGARLDIGGKVVINWGVNSVVDPLNPHGFNLGSNATLYFGGASGIGYNDPPAVLNVDVSGNPSQVYGNLISTAAPWAGCAVCTVAPRTRVAHAQRLRGCQQLRDEGIVHTVLHIHA